MKDIERCVKNFVKFYTKHIFKLPHLKGYSEDNYKKFLLDCIKVYDDYESRLLATNNLSVIVKNIKSVSIKTFEELSFMRYSADHILAEYDENEDFIKTSITNLKLKKGWNEL